MIYAVIKSGATLTEDEDLTIQKLNALGVPTVEINGTVETADIAAEAITNAKLALEAGGNEGAVKDNVVGDDAAIQLVKLEGVTSLSLVVGNDSGVAAAHTIGGDLSLSRCVQIEVQETDPGAVLDINVDDVIRFATTAGMEVGKVVSVVDNGNNKDVYFKSTTSTGTLKTAVEDVLVMPSSIAVVHTHDEVTPPVSQISVGDIISTSDGSAIVQTVSAYPGTGVVNGLVWDYEVTVGLVAVIGHLIASDSLSIDRTLDSGDTIAVEAASGAVAKGRTTLDGGNNTIYDTATSVLSATVTGLDTEANLVKTTRLVAESTATDGQVLTVQPDGVTITAENLPTGQNPLAKGELDCVPADFLEGNTEIGSWDIKGGFYYGTTGRTLLVLYNANRTSTPESRWAIGNEIVVAHKNAAGDLTPVGLDTPLSVYNVTNVYNYQTVDGAGATDMVALELDDSLDSPIDVDNTGSVTSAGATLGYIGRRVTDTGALLTGAKLFKTRLLDQPRACYALIFDDAAPNDEYIPIIQGMGLWEYGYPDGRYKTWGDAPPATDDLTGYTSYRVPGFVLGNTKTTSGFNFLMGWQGNNLAYDTRRMSILVMP